MKKFKKLFCMFLVLILAMAAAGCSSSKETDPQKVLENAQNKNSELTSSDLTLNIAMDITAAGESISMDMDMDCKSKGTGDTAQLAMTSTINTMGMGITMEMYYNDGYLYANILDQKLKQYIPLEDVQDQVIPSTQTFSLTGDALKELSMEQDGSNQKISFTADGSKMTDLVNMMISQLQSQLGDDVTYTVQDMTGTITVNSDGYLAEETFQIPMTITVPDVGDMSMDLTCTVTNHNPGEEVTIEFPDFSDYTESDLSSLV